MTLLSQATPQRPQRATLIRSFYPGLDGLRAVAFFLVFVDHYFLPPLWNRPIYRWGFVGVDLFFVLSGFLITGILYDSLHHKNYFLSFYIRRTLRIFPVFYGVWLLLLVLTPFWHIAWNGYNVAMAAYIGNFFLPGASYGLHVDPGTLFYLSKRHAGFSAIAVSHFWSLCIEEQFYLIWPAVVWFIRSRRTLLLLCMAVIGIAPLLRAVFLYSHPSGYLSLYFNTFSRADTLLVGAALALWLRGPQTTVIKVRRVAYILTLGAPLFLWLSVSLNGAHATTPIADPVVCTLGYTLIALTGAGILLLAIDSNPFTTLLQIRPLAAIGRMSYGLYIFHGLIAPYILAKALTFHRYHGRLLVPMLGFACSYIIAWLSFRFLESPFLRLKDILAPRAGAISDPPPIPLHGETAPTPSPTQTVETG